MNENGNDYANSRYKFFIDSGFENVSTYIDENGGIWFFKNDVVRILGIESPHDVTKGLENSGLFVPLDSIEGSRICIKILGGVYNERKCICE